MVHPNSGAGSIKDDGHDEENVYEVKDAMSTFTLNGKELKATHKRAVRQGRTAVWLVQFTELGITAEITVTQQRRHTA